MNKNNFTVAQLKWASEHDWFVFGDLQKIIGCESGHGFANTCEFTDFKALRDWAGY